MGRPGLPAHTARARFGKPIERWGRKASGPEQRSWIAGLPADPTGNTSARAICRNLLSLREPSVPHRRRVAVARWGCQLRAGHRHNQHRRDSKGVCFMEAHHLLRRAVWAGLAAAALATTAHAQVDPGVRGGAAAAGSPFADLTTNERSFFDVGLEDFEEAEGVGEGMGPRFNLDGCAGCHLQPAVGGTSPAVNPQVAVATAFGAQNTVPSFITLNGPVREARFVANSNGSRDGGVHALFTIRGRVDDTGNASGCTAAQEDFAAQVARNNVIFRIPTPTFGAGLMEMIPDQTLVNNVNASPNTKAAFGISGRLNRNGNDGTVSRFGWKAQNESLLLFSGEAYNVEMGISNELFQVERDENATCQFATHPNDVTNVDGPLPPDTVRAIEKFAFFMRFLAPPTPSTNTPG